MIGGRLSAACYARARHRRPEHPATHDALSIMSASSRCAKATRGWRRGNREDACHAWNACCSGLLRPLATPVVKHARSAQIRLHSRQPWRIIESACRESVPSKPKQHVHNTVISTKCSRLRSSCVHQGVSATCAFATCAAATHIQWRLPPALAFACIPGDADQQ